MWFSKIHARAFGPMKNQSLEFEKGLNIVHGANESGKSSWHAAIVVSLCGLRRGPGRTKAEREFEDRHRPWDSGDDDPWFVQAGVMFDDGRHIEIDRDLDNRTTDVRRADLGGRVFADLPMNNGSPDGSMLLGLDRETFPMTASVRQASIVADLGEPDALQQHLARAATGGAGDTAAGALQRIGEYKKEHVGLDRSNSRKPLRTAMNDVEGAEDDLEAVKEAHREYEKLASSLDAHRREVERLTGERVAVEAQRDYVTAKQATERLGNAAKEVDKWEKRFIDGDPSRSELPELTELAEALGSVENLPEPQLTSLESVEDLERLISSLEPEESRPCPSVEEVRACVAALRDISASNVRLPNRNVAWKWAVGVGLAVASIAGAVAGLSIGGLTAVVAAVVAGVVAALVTGRIASQRAQPFSAGADRGVSGSERVDALSRLDEWQLSHDPVEAVTQSASRVEARAELSRLRERLNERRRFDKVEARRSESHSTAWRELRTAAGAHGVTGTEDNVRKRVRALLDGRRSARVQHNEDIKEWARYQKALDGRTPQDWRDEARRARADEEKALRRLEQFGADCVDTETSAQDLEPRVRHIGDLLRQAEGRAQFAAGELSKIDQDSVDVAAVEARLSEAREELARVNRLAATLDITSGFLERAAEEAHMLVAPRLAEQMSPWVQEVTRGRYERVEVDPGDLNVTLVTAAGNRRDARLVSRGTTEQIYLVLRLVLAQVLSAVDETCPVLLDDPTVHADAARKTKILNYLLAASKEHQVIVFSQEQEVLDWAKNQSDGAVRLMELAEPQPA